jgi:serine protease
MKLLVLLFLSLFILPLVGCTSSNDSSDSIRIVFDEKEKIAPADWVFEVAGGEDITSYQWQFSGGFPNITSTGEGSSIEYTFEEPGVYQVRLNYQTLAGIEKTIATEVVIGSGSISGTITAALDTLVDVDTRDSAEPNITNNSFDTAQVISANTLLSGIVDKNDQEDFYQVQLQADQLITLQVAEEGRSAGYEQIRLELFRADLDGNPNFVMSSTTRIDNGRLLTVVDVDSTDNYFIKLIAIDAISLAEGDTHGIYSLAINAKINAAAKDYAPGEINIMLKPNRQYQAQGLTSNMDLGRIKTLSIDDAQAFLAGQNMIFSTPSMTSILTTEEQAQWQMLQTLEMLAVHPDILYAEPNWRRYASLSEINDPLYPAQWHYDTINAEQAWEAMDSRGSANVTVAVIDTGVLLDHPDLSSNLVDGYDYVGDGSSREAEDDDPNDPGDKTINGQRSSFHGTHVAGTIAASAANEQGGVGVAANVKIMPVRVLGKNGGFSSDIIAGVCFAAQMTNADNGICENSNQAEKAADIINLSLGGEFFSNIEQAVYDAVTAKGIIVIAAAGNESTDQPFYPAAYDKVISVSAINRNLEQARYSNFGPTIDVAAPGGDSSVDRGILSTLGDDRSEPTTFTYGSLQGTSMAAPHVAGVAALMKSIKPSLNHNEFLGYLNAGNLTQDLGAEGRDDIYGMGLIDAHKAVLKVLQDSTPQILSSNNNLFFNVSQSRITFSLTSSNGDDLGEINVEIQEASNNAGGFWLQLNKNSGLGDYQVTVERSGLPEGSYQAQLLVSATSPEVDDLIISVQLQVGNPELSANAGVQYVLVIDPDAEPDQNGTVLSQASSSALFASNGKYSYQITGLKKGSYTVSTGSDLDLDFLICDAGESCGQYPTIDQPTTVIISEEQPDLDINMSVNYVNTEVGITAVDSLIPLPDEVNRLPVPSLSRKILQKNTD